MLSDSANDVLTTSNAILRLATTLVKLNNGTSANTDLNLYCSVDSPCIIAVPCPLPNSVLLLIAEFNTAINCSNQFGFVGSFQIITCCAKSFPVLSIIDSDVDIVSNFNNPVAELFRFALYDNNLDSRSTDSLVSASSMKFSRLAKSIRNAKL